MRRTEIRVRETLTSLQGLARGPRTIGRISGVGFYLADLTLTTMLVRGLVSEYKGKFRWAGAFAGCIEDAERSDLALAKVSELKEGHRYKKKGRGVTYTLTRDSGRAVGVYTSTSGEWRTWPVKESDTVLIMKPISDYYDPMLKSAG